VKFKLAKQEYELEIPHFEFFIYMPVTN